MTNALELIINNINPDDIFAKSVLSIGYVKGLRQSLKDTLFYVEADTCMTGSVDVLCDVRNLIKTFDYESFDVVICTTLDRIYDWRTAIHNLKSVCKTGGKILIPLSNDGEWRFQKIINSIFSDFKILNTNPLKALKIKTMEVNLAKVKPKKGSRKIKVPTPKYVGTSELYFPQFKKIVNKGDLLPELPLWEARERDDFIVLNDKGDK